MAVRNKSAWAQDTTAIAGAYTDGLAKYYDRPVSVSGLIQSLGGDKGAKSQLARELAGIGPGKLPGKGTRERTDYDTAQRNIGRWLKTESGAPGQKRRPDSESLGKLKAIQDKLTAPPVGASIDFDGLLVGSDEKPRRRHFSVTLPNINVTAEQFMNHMKEGNLYEAYQDMFEAYKIGRDVVIATDDSPDIDVEFF